MIDRRFLPELKGPRKSQAWTRNQSHSITKLTSPNDVNENFSSSRNPFLPIRRVFCYALGLCALCVFLLCFFLMEVSRVALNTIIASHPKKKKKGKRRMRISLMLALTGLSNAGKMQRRRRRRKKKRIRIRVVPFTVIKKKMEKSDFN